MNNQNTLAFEINPSELPVAAKERHEAFVDLFGQFLFWLRSWALGTSERLIESEDARQALGTIRRSFYDGVANLPPDQRKAAMLLAEETLNGFIERLVWFLGD